jgi:superfamily II DNA/RNA helicase
MAYTKSTRYVCNRHSHYVHSSTAYIHALLLQVLREGAPEPPQQTDTTAVTSSEQLAPRTMVFTNTAASCKAAHATLQSAGISAVPYHKDLTLPERAENLAAFRSGDVPVLVCTDLAARGLDIPDVTHIVQFEFALNVVQHLHRLGRAARAGRRGAATSFWDSKSAELAKSVRAAGVAGTMDDSFSRRRGFRKKFR